MTNGRSRSRTGIHVAIVAIAITAGLGAVGAAGAADDGDPDESRMRGQTGGLHGQRRGQLMIHTDDDREMDFRPPRAREHDVEVDDTVT